jgi:hypothetical protein
MTHAVSHEWLSSINPTCAAHPPGYSLEQQQDDERRVSLVASRLSSSLGRNCVVETAQDATFFASISLPLVGLKSSGLTPCVRFSRFEKLCTITMEHRMTHSDIALVRATLTDGKFVFVDASLLGEPFNSRQRFSGDLFNQLFDYI